MNSNLRLESRGWWTGALVAGFLLVVWLSKYHLVANFGNMTPFWDQWDAEADGLYRPWIEGSLRWTNLLAAHNEHRIVTTRIVALALFLLNGRDWNPVLLMQVNAIIYAAAMSFLTFKLSRFLTGWSRLVIFPIAAGVFILPYAWENTLMAMGGGEFYIYLWLNSVFLWAMVSRRSYTFPWWLGLALGGLSFLTMASGAVTLTVGAFLLGVRRFFLRDAGSSVSSIVLLAVMAATAAVNTPTIQANAALRAQSAGQFFNALLLGASWPFSSSVFAAIVVHTPLLVFAALFLLRRIAPTPPALYVLALAGWLYAQLFLISYGRAVGPDASRYLDFHAIGLVLNAAVLLDLFCRIQPGWWKRGASAVVMLLWFCLVARGLFLSSEKWGNDVGLKAAQSREQEDNVRGYLLTKNPEFLLNKPHLAIPYPDAERLKALLDSGTIQALLPPELSREKQASLIGRPSR